MSWENWDRGQLEAPAHETAHSFRRESKIKNLCKRLPVNLICVEMVLVCVSPLLVCEQCVCLQPGSDVRVYWEAVVGAGSLELPDLRENLKLLREEEIKRNAD